MKTRVVYRHHMKARAAANDTKMKELILHVAEASQADEKFGAQKLNKILFYADFLSYLQRGKSITGQEYFALSEGPAPKRLLPIREAMCESGDIAIKRANYFGLPQERLVALRRPNYSELEAEDIALVDAIIEKLRGKNGKEVSEESHKFAGWRIAFAKGEKTLIPYSLVRFDLKGFLGIPTPQIPQSLIVHGRSIYRRLPKPQLVPEPA
jgi:hypothetical protein